jgi:branched-chain amino acid transport system ATP-binding protein
LLLDEPSLGLSPLICKELFAVLGHIKELGVGVLLVEQNATQSLAIGDRGYLLENGRIVGEGTASALQEDPAVRHAYLGGSAAGAANGSRAARGPEPLSNGRLGDGVAGTARPPSPRASSTSPLGEGQHKAPTQPDAAPHPNPLPASGERGQGAEGERGSPPTPAAQPTASKPFRGAKPCSR